jgi:UDP-N-acetylmuramoyl-tripeptide--D-alanyl-D-alanine ligase
MHDNVWPDNLWTSDEIVRATGGALTGPPFAISGLSIDTRSLRPGELFVALAGERDGHAFLDAAFTAGASGALVARDIGGRPGVKVNETLQGLERLAAAARDRAPARRAAITGSVGKTSVTQAVAASLRLAGPSHAPVKSFNNHIGVPLTLAALPRDAAYAVFELGMNHAGEIAPLARLVRPHVATITTVGPVHVENFPDGEAGVAQAKAEIFEGLEAGATAVLNADDAWFELLAEAARSRGARVLSFGRAPGCDARVLGFERGPEASGAVVEAALHGRPIRFPIAQDGAHWGPNSLATLLTVEALGAPIDCAFAALTAFAPLSGRGETRRLAVAGGAIALVDESYNANPISMRATIATLAAAPHRRIAVLTDMLELGPDAPRHHAALASDLESADVDQVFLAGPLMRHLWDALPTARRGAWAPSAADLAPTVVSAVQAGDTVMVKGSNGSKASLIVQALSAAHPTPSSHPAGAPRP